MDWNLVITKIEILFEKIWSRYLKYKSDKKINTNLYLFCLFLQQLKIHAKSKELNICKILINKSTLSLEKSLHLQTSENLGDYKNLRNTVIQEWQTILKILNIE